MIKIKLVVVNGRISKVIADFDLQFEYPQVISYAIINPDLMAIEKKADGLHVYYNELHDNHLPLVQGLPEHSEKGVKYIYINVIQPQHQSFADSIDGLAITDRPKPEDYD